MLSNVVATSPPYVAIEHLEMWLGMTEELILSCNYFKYNYN